MCDGVAKFDVKNTMGYERGRNEWTMTMGWKERWEMVGNKRKSERCKDPDKRVKRHGRKGRFTSRELLSHFDAQEGATQSDMGLKGRGNKGS